jgi:hypothetical protein
MLNDITRDRLGASWCAAAALVVASVAAPGVSVGASTTALLLTWFLVQAARNHPGLVARCPTPGARSAPVRGRQETRRPLATWRRSLAVGFGLGSGCARSIRA